MTRPFISSLVLILLLIGYVAAGPEPDPRPRAVRSSTCQEHTSLHKRMDVVEKKVEDTVEKLDVEITALLDAIEDTNRQQMLDSSRSGTVVDILDDVPHI